MGCCWKQWKKYYIFISSLEEKKLLEDLSNKRVMFSWKNGIVRKETCVNHNAQKWPEVTWIRKVTAEKLGIIKSCIIDWATLWVFYLCLSSTYSCTWQTILCAEPAAPVSIMRVCVVSPSCFQMSTLESVAVNCNSTKWKRDLKPVKLKIHYGHYLTGQWSWTISACDNSELQYHLNNVRW